MNVVHRLHVLRWFVLVMLAAACGRPTDTPTPTSGPLGVTLAVPLNTPRSTRLPGERTPPPTLTPAPTATPVIHFVQPGETLIDIAQSYGISLDALQAANGVLRPETLQIGQQLIIPSGLGVQPSSSGGLLLPTPTPLPVSVHGVALYETPAGSLWVLGEVLNGAGTALENTQVRVALQDESGAELAVATVFSALDVIPVDGKSPFGVLFQSPPPGVVAFSVTPIRAEASSEPGNRYMPIVVQSQQGVLDGLQFKVSGTLVNQGGAGATDVNVVLTTYDAAGRVTGWRQAVAGDGGLAAGSQVDFEISLVPNGPAEDVPQAATAPADYAVIAQGRTAQP